MASNPNVALRGQTGVERGITLLNAVDSTGAGTGFGLGRAYTVFSLVQYRASTGTAGGSTKPSYRIQGSVVGPGSTEWFTIGAATRAVTTTAKSLAAVTSTAGICAIRASINNFSTSSGSNPDKVALTVRVLPVS